MFSSIVFIYSPHGGQVKGEINYQAQASTLRYFFTVVAQTVEGLESLYDAFECVRTDCITDIRYQDWLDVHDTTSSKALVLDGWMKAWMERYGTDQSLTQEYTMEQRLNRE